MFGFEQGTPRPLDYEAPSSHESASEDRAKPAPEVQPWPLARFRRLARVCLEDGWSGTLLRPSLHLGERP